MKSKKKTKKSKTKAKTTKKGTKKTKLGQNLKVALEDVLEQEKAIHTPYKPESCMELEWKGYKNAHIIQNLGFEECKEADRILDDTPETKQKIEELDKGIIGRFFAKFAEFFK